MQTARVLPARASPTGFGMSSMKLSGKVIILDVLLGATKRNGRAHIVKSMALSVK